MTNDTYKQMRKLVAEELNVHEVIEQVGDFAGKPVAIHFWTSLGFSQKPDRLFLKVKDEEWEDSPTLDKLIALM
jgi:hypothetical protein